jgi:hypothetical protein
LIRAEAHAMKSRGLLTSINSTHLLNRLDLPKKSALINI